MNLEELKSIWQEVTVRELPGETLELRELRQMLAAKSQGAIGSLKRMIWWESAMILLMAGLILTWFLTGELAYSWQELAAVFCFLAVSARFYWVKYQALSQPMHLDADLKTALQKIVSALDRYVRFYQLISVVFVPLCAAGGVLYGFFRQGKAEALDPQLIGPPEWGLILLVTVAFSGAMLVFSRWYTQRYYLRRLVVLKACLRELEGEPES